MEWISRIFLALCGLVIAVTCWSQGGRAPWIPSAFGWIALIGTVAVAILTGLQVAARSKSRLRFIALRVVVVLPWFLLAFWMSYSVDNPCAKPLETDPTRFMSVGPDEARWDRPVCLDPIRTAQVSKILLGCLGLGALAYFGAQGLSSIRWLVGFLALNGVVVALVGLMASQADVAPSFLQPNYSDNFRDWGFLRNVDRERISLFGPFRYHNHWGAFALLSLCCALAWLTSVQMMRRTSRSHEADKNTTAPVILGVVAVALILLGGFLGGGRWTWAWLSLVVGVAILWGFWRIGRRKGWGLTPRLASVTGALLLVAGLVWLVAGKQITHEFKATELALQKADEGRVVVIRPAFIKAGYVTAKARPWLGWGMGSTRIMLPMNIDPEAWASWRQIVTFAPRPVEFAHNDWIQIWLELGFLGCLLMVLPVLLVTVFTLIKGRGNPLALWLAVGVGAVLCFATWDFPLSNPAVLSCFSVMFGLSAKASVLARRKYGSKRKSRSSGARGRGKSSSGRSGAKSGGSRASGSSSASKRRRKMGATGRENVA